MATRNRPDGVNHREAGPTKRERRAHISGMAAGKNCAADAAKYQNESSKKFREIFWHGDDSAIR